jgi:hypothetical protein
MSLSLRAKSRVLLAAQVLGRISQKKAPHNCGVFFFEYLARRPIHRHSHFCNRVRVAKPTARGFCRTDMPPSTLKTYFLDNISLSGIEI